MAIFLKTEDEIELMRRSNRLVGKTLGVLASYIKPGITTLQLDKIAEEYIHDNGALPSFKCYPNPFGGPFPASICTSVNDVVVHGIPDKKTVLKDGDIISIDCGILFDGYHGDSCYTFCVGEVTDDITTFLRTVKESLYRAISNATAGNHLGDIGYAVQNCCESSGYGIVRGLTGHGIGRKMHEDPLIPNYGKKNSGLLLKSGMCLSIEPMVTMGDCSICLMPDRWSIRTRDRRLSAHFEHTVVVRNGCAEILSSFDEIESLEENLY